MVEIRKAETDIGVKNLKHQVKQPKKLVQTKINVMGRFSIHFWRE